MQMSVCECVSVHAAHCALKLFNQVTKARVSKTFKEIENFDSLKRESLKKASRELQVSFKTFKIPSRDLQVKRATRELRESFRKASRKPH